MEILQILSLIFSLIGIIISIAAVVLSKSYSLKENKLKISFLSKISLLVLTISLIIVGVSIMKTQSLTIIKPTIGQVFSNCTEIDTIGTDKQVFFETLVRVNTRLSNDQLVTLFVQVTDGKEWWISSKPVRNDDIINNTAYFPHVTIGKKNDGNKSYVLLAAITKQRFSSGMVIDALPEDIKISDRVMIYKECK